MAMNEHSFVKGPSEDESGVLRYCGKVSVQSAPIGASGQFVFKRTVGLWVEKTFTDLLGESVFLEVGNVEVDKYQLQEKARSSDILRTIGTGGIYRGEEGKDALKRIIASGISTQWRGEPGLFRTDAQSNLFYFEQNGTLYVVKVFRVSIVREWDVIMWQMDTNMWDTGDVVFAPTAEVPREEDSTK